MKDIRILVFGTEIRALQLVLQAARPAPHEMRHASQNATVEAWLVANELLDRLEGAIRHDRRAELAPEPVTDRPTLRMRRPTPQTVGDWPEMKCTCPPSGFGNEHDDGCPAG